MCVTLTVGILCTELTMNAPLWQHNAGHSAEGYVTVVSITTCSAGS